MMDDQKWEPGDMLALLYTVGFLAMVAGVMYVSIPKDNVQIVNTLVTIMSTIQIGIGKCYYDRSKSDTAVQRAAADQQAKVSSTIQEIAKAAPVPPTLASDTTPKVTPAAAQADGTIPAASALEVQPTNGKVIP